MMDFDIEDALESRSEGKRYYCPVCDPDCEHTASLAMKEAEKGHIYWICYRCKKTFSKKSLLNELGIAEKYHSHVKIDRKHLTESNAKIDKDEINLVYAASYPVVESAEFLRKLQNWRGWSEETIEIFGIRYLPQQAIFDFPKKYESWMAGSYVNERGAKIFSPGWFLFPFFNKFQKIIYIKARNFVTDAANKKYKRFKNTKGSLPFPYGMWLSVNIDAKKQEIFICEGETDTLSANSFGHFAVGIPGANAFRQSWCKYFQDLNVCIAFDIDKPDKLGHRAGQNALYGYFTKPKHSKPKWIPGLIEQLKPFAKRVRIFQLPAGFNDYSDYFQSNAQINAKPIKALRPDGLGLTFNEYKFYDQNKITPKGDSDE